MSPQAEKVQKFVAYLSTQLQDIPPDLWSEFTLENMRLINNYIKRGQPAPAPAQVSTSFTGFTTSTPDSFQLPYQHPMPPPPVFPQMSHHQPRAYLPPSPQSYLSLASTSQTSPSSTYIPGVSTASGVQLSSQPSPTQFASSPPPAYTQMHTPQMVPVSPVCAASPVVPKTTTCTTTAEATSTLTTTSDVIGLSHQLFEDVM